MHKKIILLFLISLTILLSRNHERIFAGQNGTLILTKSCNASCHPEDPNNSTCGDIVYVHGMWHNSWGGTPNCDCGVQGHYCYREWEFQWPAISFSMPKIEDVADALNDELNNAINAGTIGNYRTIFVGHSAGNLIIKAAVLRATGQLVNYWKNSRVVQVAPFIGGSKALKQLGRVWVTPGILPPFIRPGPAWFNIVQNYSIFGGLQKLLYRDNPNALKDKTAGDYILFARGDATAPNGSLESWNPYLHPGEKEDMRGAPYVEYLFGPDSHSKIKDSPNVCKMILNGTDPCTAAPPAPRSLVLLEGITITKSDPQDMRFTIKAYNNGSPTPTGTAIKATLTTSDPHVTIIKKEYDFGPNPLATDEDRDQPATDAFILQNTFSGCTTVPLELSFSPNAAEEPKTKFKLFLKGVIWTHELWRWDFTSLRQKKQSLFARNIFSSKEAEAGIADPASDPEEPFMSKKLGSHPILADLDKNGKMEVIVPAKSGDNRIIKVLNSDGTFRWSYTLGSQSEQVYPAVADLYNDGNLEIILAESDTDMLEVLTKDGVLKWSYDGAYYGVKIGIPTIADINQDGKPEIIVAKEGKVTAIDSTGNVPKVLWQTDVGIGFTPLNGAPVVADVNGDGKPEIITGDLCILHLDTNGTPLGLWINYSGHSPEKVPLLAGNQPVAVGDLNGDGNLEIVSGARCFKYENGRFVQKWQYCTDDGGLSIQYPPVLADIDQDGKLEILLVGIDSTLYVLKSDGSLLWKFQPDTDTEYLTPAVPLDLDGDGRLEIIISDSENIYLLSYDGTRIYHNYQVEDDFAPLVADIDKDGKLELIVGLLQDEIPDIKCFNIGVANAGAVFYPQFQFDNARTGCFNPLESTNPNAIPNAPTNLVANATRNTASVSWIDNSNNEAGFTICRLVYNGALTSWGQPFNIPANSIVFNDHGFMEGQEYGYAIRAYNNHGAASAWAYSNRFFPGSPTKLTATVQTQSSGNQIQLTWQNNAQLETGFTVERKVGTGAFTQIATLPAYPYSIIVTYTDNSPFTLNTPYAYRVTAIPPTGKVYGYSNEAMVTLSLSAPTNLTANLQPDNTVIISWSNNSTGVTSFQLQGIMVTSGGNIVLGSSEIDNLSANATTYTSNIFNRPWAYPYQWAYFRVAALFSSNGQITANAISNWIAVKNPKAK